MIRLILIALLLAGCAGPQWCKTVTVPAQEIAVCGPEYFRGMSGRYGNWMITWGWMENGQIVVDNEMLGHEMRHQMQKQDEAFKDPDKQLWH